MQYFILGIVYTCIYMCQCIRACICINIYVLTPSFWLSVGPTSPHSLPFTVLYCIMARACGDISTYIYTYTYPHVYMCVYIRIRLAVKCVVFVLAFFMYLRTCVYIDMYMYLHTCIYSPMLMSVCAINQREMQRKWFTRSLRHSLPDNTHTFADMCVCE